jgi:HEAT repeat protein
MVIDEIDTFFDGTVTDPVGLNILREALESESDGEVAAYELSVLGFWFSHDAATIPLLRAKLSDSRPEVRLAAAEILKVVAGWPAPPTTQGRPIRPLLSR